MSALNPMDYFSKPSKKSAKLYWHRITKIDELSAAWVGELVGFQLGLMLGGGAAVSGLVSAEVILNLIVIPMILIPLITVGVTLLYNTLAPWLPLRVLCEVKDEEGQEVD